LPSPVVASANSTTGFPLFIASTICALTSGMPRRRRRSIKMTPCSRASRPPSADAPISFLARNIIGSIEPRTGISSQDT
jgi:hypothetical protein